MFKAWDSALLLLRKGANPNLVALKCKKDMLTPLYVAAEKGSLEVCQSLLENGARQDLGGEYLVDHICHFPHSGPKISTDVMQLIFIIPIYTFDMPCRK